MHPGVLSIDNYRRAADGLSRVARGDVQVASRVVGEVLVARARDHAPGISIAMLDAQMQTHGATESTATVDGTAPLAALRTASEGDAERALVSVLLARHVGELLDGSNGATTVRGLLPSLDWLEFNGPFAPYTAARAALSSDTLSRFEKLLQESAVEAPSTAAANATRSLRGLGAASVGDALPTVKEEFPAGLRVAGENVSVAGEVEGLHRGPAARTISIVTGWALVRGLFLGAGRLIFSFRRPMTVSLDGEALRVVGHTELLGRTLRTFDVRYPIDQLVEIRREVRFPALPVAVSLVGLALGAFFGARAVVEGAGVAYFPLIGLGIGLILGGLVFDLLVRAIFPGLRGQGRIVVRATGSRALVLTNLAIEEADKLLDAIDRRFGASGNAKPSSGTKAGTAPKTKPATKRA